MIKEFVDAWDKNKSKLEEHLRTHKQEEYSSYRTLLKLLIDLVINPHVEETMNGWDSGAISVIDDGDYQGTELFLVPQRVYQPSVNEYFITYQYYGSCSICDVLEGICDGTYDELPTEEQVKEYMTLELHLLQRCKYLTE